MKGSKNEKSIRDSSLKISQQLIDLWENSSEVWVVKDTSSRYIAWNSAFYDFLNLPNHKDIYGLKDEQLPHETAEYAHLFYAQDREVQKSKRVKSLDVSRYGRNKELQAYIAEKCLIRDPDNQEIIGVIGHARRAEMFTPLHHMLGHPPTCFTTTPPVDTFTAKELHIIFLINMKLKAKEIASLLSLSPRTVENKIRDIYQKAEVNCKGDFIDYCNFVGLHKYIPEMYLQKGSTILSIIELNKR